MCVNNFKNGYMYLLHAFICDHLLWPVIPESDYCTQHSAEIDLLNFQVLYAHHLFINITFSVTVLFVTLYLFKKKNTLLKVYEFQYPIRNYFKMIDYRLEFEEYVIERPSPQTSCPPSLHFSPLLGPSPPPHLLSGTLPHSDRLAGRGRAGG